MGLRRLGPDAWLELEHPRLVEQREAKVSLMERMGDELLITLPAADEPSAELLADIESIFARRGHDRPDIDQGLHPLDAAARLIREDLVVHVEVDGRYLVAGGSVCFPTRWVLADKVGQPLDLVHSPVPGYQTDVADRVTTFLNRLEPGPGVWRRNWSLMPTDDLCLPGRHDYLPLGARPESLWFRTERQTLRRLARTGAVVFSIGIDVEPLSGLAADRPTALALADTIETLGDEFRAYKGLAERGDDIVAYLRDNRD